MKIHAAVLAGSLGIMAFALTAHGAVTVGNALRVGNQLQFTITGESNANYIIESSTNLQHWSPLLTNRDSNTTRTVTVNITAPRSYYRARIARSFTGSLAARGFIELRGNNIVSDSFDSADANYSTTGRYDPSKAQDGGNIAAYSGLTNALNVGNAKIYGKLSLGPGGSASIGPYGVVGSTAWVNNSLNAGMIQPGWLCDDIDSWFPEVSPPDGNMLFPSAGTVGGTNYAYVLGTAGYRLQSFNMTSNTTMLVTGRATFWVHDDLSISGTAKIVIAPGASLILYLGMPTGSGSAASIAGGGIINQNASALAFQYYGLPSNTSLTLSGNGDFVGTIYAPSADFAFAAGGASTQDVSGAIIAKTITMSGHLHFHYDENLAQAGPLF